MADITMVKEKVLDAVSSIASGDFLRVVTSGGHARKIDYNLLAKAIIENYTGSSVAGSNQSVKAALDSLNSNAMMPGSVNYTGDINNITKMGYYYGSANMTGLPDGVTGAHIYCFRTSYRITQFLLPFNMTALFVRNSADSGTTWASWKKAALSAV